MVIIMGIITVIIMVLCLGISLQGIEISNVKLSSFISRDLGHAELLLFSCLCSKVAVYS